MKAWLQNMLFDWVFVLLYKLLQAFLNLVDFIESFFDVFAGTAKIYYKGSSEFLFNVFFGHDAVTNAFWAMALIAIVMAFGFCIVQLARKTTDVTGSVKQSVGQIVSNFLRCLLIIVMLNAATVAAINISNVLLDRINYALENAHVLNREELDRSFSEQEYATMTKIFATVANYSVNPSSESRYNVNSCFNAIRADLLSLHANGFFDYDYPLDDNGHYTWQGALALLASSADLTQDLNLDTYYSDVVAAFRTVNHELNNYSDFAPIKSARFATLDSIDTDVLIFLITGMEASNNSLYDRGDFHDAIRKGYISGEKSYNDLGQVRKDFDIWDMDYLVGYIASIVFIIVMAICIFTFIVRLFNLLLLYITAPLFVASMPMDDGSKWQSWTQAFIIQLFSGFGIIIAMRLYLIIIPVILSSDLVFFAGSGADSAMLNRMAQLLMVLGGAWAVLQSGSVIIGILAGNPGMAAIQQEGQIGSKVMGWATRAPRAAVGSAVGLAAGAARGAKYLGGAKERRQDKMEDKAKLATRKAQRKQNVADARAAQADKLAASGKASKDEIQRARASADKAQKSADKAAETANKRNIRAGTKPSDAAIERDPRYDPNRPSGDTGSEGGASGDGSVPERARDAGASDAAVNGANAAAADGAVNADAAAADAPYAYTGGRTTTASGRTLPPEAPPARPSANERAEAVRDAGSADYAYTGGRSTTASGRTLPKNPPPARPTSGSDYAYTGGRSTTASGRTLPKNPPPARPTSGSDYAYTGGRSTTASGRTLPKNPPPARPTSGSDYAYTGGRSTTASGRTLPTNPPPARPTSGSDYAYTGGRSTTASGRTLPTNPPPARPTSGSDYAYTGGRSTTASGRTLPTNPPPAPPSSGSDHSYTGGRSTTASGRTLPKNPPPKPPKDS